MTDLPQHLKLKVENDFPAPARVQQFATGKSIAKLFPDLKLRALVSFPAAVNGGTGIAVRKQDGNFYFDLAYSKLAPPVVSVPDPSHQNVVLWNNVSGQYSLAPTTLLGSGLASSDLKNYLAGLILSTAGGSTSFSVAAGVAADSTNAALVTLAAAISKTTAVWVVGSGTGSFDGTGAAPSATADWYHAYLIRRPDTGMIDVLTSRSATAPTLPAGYSQFRRIGAMKTSGAFQWLKFIQTGDTFVWDTPVAITTINNPGTAAVTRVAEVPTGIIATAIMGIVIAASNPSTDAPGSVLLTDLAQADTVASANNFSFYCYAAATTTFQLGGRAEVNTNTNGQFRSRLQISGAGTNVFLTTIGWKDQRGKDA